MNVDLDYFVYRYRPRVLIFSDAFVQKIFQVIKKGISKKSVSVLTIALSPECCGGWKRAEALLSLVSDTLELAFTLRRTRRLKPRA